MSGLNIFNAHPALYWGHESTFAKPWISIGAREHAGRSGRQDPHRRHRLRHHRRARPVDGRRRADRARVPELGDDSRPAVAGDGAPLALLLRLDLRRSTASPTCSTRIFSRHLAKDLVPTRDELRNIGRSILDHLKFKHPDRRGGDALQRAAEPHLPGRHLRPAAAGGDRRAGDVAAPGRRLHRLGRPARRPAVGAHAALPRRARPRAASSSSTSSRWSSPASGTRCAR